MLLNPFLDVIRSGNTTGPIAGAALSSVEKFLQYGIIGKVDGGNGNRFIILTYLTIETIRFKQP
jgi:hypothetical protein